jgi:hypothetical protein
VSNFLIGFLFGVIVGAITWEVVKWGWNKIFMKG